MPTKAMTALASVESDLLLVDAGDDPDARSHGSAG